MQMASPKPVQQQFSSAQQQSQQNFGNRAYSQPAAQPAYGQSSFDQPDFNRPFTINSPQQQQMQQAQQVSSYTVAKDIEVISSKLDALRASLDIINQRLANLERISEREQVRKRTGW